MKGRSLYSTSDNKRRMKCPRSSSPQIELIRASARLRPCPSGTKAAQELGKKLGVEITQAYITTGDNDLLLIIDASDGGNVTKFALALSSLGNVRTRTARAWPETEYVKVISELP